MHFEWDRAKAARNRRKHGITFDEAVTVFHDPMKPKHTDELRPEYDFDYSKAVRGKYYKRLLKEGSNVVVLERDVAKAFPSSASVNDALRSVLKSRRARRLTPRSTRARNLLR